jgi:hypothetical protein
METNNLLAEYYLNLLLEFADKISGDKTSTDEIQLFVESIQKNIEFQINSLISQIFNLQYTVVSENLVFYCSTIRELQVLFDEITFKFNSINKSFSITNYSGNISILFS